MKKNFYFSSEFKYSTGQSKKVTWMDWWIKWIVTCNKLFCRLPAPLNESVQNFVYKYFFNVFNIFMDTGQFKQTPVIKYIFMHVCYIL